ncbi:MAG: hypothetical protein K9J30_01070 [Bacteroidales bacterium]|nr:hypothetical protein [Bacteroidales bacterium]
MFSCPLVRASMIIYPWLVKREKYIFLLFLFIAMLQLWLTRYVPSLDGPQHLYNANVLAEMISGNEFIRSFFRVNDVIVGYWTGHFFLAFFKIFLPAWLAEKFFLSAYVIAMVFSFRYFVSGLNPMKGNFVSYLVFPFIYHSYLLLGYYTFSIAAIFFFLAFGYWTRYGENFSWRRTGVFALILTGLFLSHGLVYVLFGYAFIIYLLVTFLYERLNKEIDFSLTGWLVKLLKIAAATVPSGVLCAIYIRSVMSVNNTIIEPSYTFAELVKFLMRIRQLVGFHHEMESVGYILLFILMAVLSVGFLILFVPKLLDGSKKYLDLLNYRNALLFVAIGMLGLYFFAPDRFSAGNLTNRFGLFFYLALISWLSVQKFPRTLQLISLLVILTGFSYTRFIQQRFYQGLNKDIIAIEELAERIEPNSVVHYLQSSNNWAHVHFQLYAAVDRPLVHLKNPQCQGQFPVVWNYVKLPVCYAGNHEVRPAGALERHEENGSLPVDYITVFQYERYMADSTNADWHRILKENYDLVKLSKDEKAALFRNISMQAD